MDSLQPGPASAGLKGLVGGTVGSEKVCPDHTLAADERGRAASGRHGSKGGDARRLQSPQTHRYASKDKELLWRQPGRKSTSEV